MARRAIPVTRPRPPAPACGGSTAIDMSARPATTGGTNGATLIAVEPRSASTNNSSRAGPSSSSRIATTEAPVSMAAALPRFWEWRTTTAPAARAACWVSSSLPSSTTSTRSTYGMARTARTVSAIRSTSSLAGMTTAARCRPPAPGIPAGAVPPAGRRRITRRDRCLSPGGWSPLTPPSLTSRARRCTDDLPGYRPRIRRALAQAPPRVGYRGRGTVGGRPRTDRSLSTRRQGRTARPSTRRYLSSRWHRAATAPRVSATTTPSAQRHLPGDQRGAGPSLLSVQLTLLGERLGQPLLERRQQAGEFIRLTAADQLPDRDHETAGPERPDQPGDRK